MRLQALLTTLALGVASLGTSTVAAAQAGALPQDLCPRAPSGSIIPEPRDLRSENGVLKVEMSVHDFREADGSAHYCYLLSDGSVAPTLRVHPGDLLILHLKNDLVDPAPPDPSPPDASHAPMHVEGHSHGVRPGRVNDPCSSGVMSAVSANLHFHGLTVPPVCHQDDVLKTSIQPNDPAFEYRFRIPDDEPPGLYWYHPHIHGFSKQQLLGGASGALIVEGIERAKKVAAGLPERVFIIRDQDLVNPNAPPAKSEPVVPKFMVDRDGDAANNGTGFGKPAKDLSINYVPVPYPDYPPATIAMKPGERQLWRILNASAITYLNLQVLFGPQAQAVEVVALDGVPIHPKEAGLNKFILLTHLGIPPGGRIEFVMHGPPEGIKAELVTRSVNTGAMGENDPNRAIARIVAKADAPEPQSLLGKNPKPLPASSTTWLRDVQPVRVRKLFFSEVPLDP